VWPVLNPVDAPTSSPRAGAEWWAVEVAGYPRAPCPLIRPIPQRASQGVSYMRRCAARERLRKPAMRRITACDHRLNGGHSEPDRFNALARGFSFLSGLDLCSSAPLPSVISVLVDSSSVSKGLDLGIVRPVIGTASSKSCSHQHPGLARGPAHALAIARHLATCIPQPARQQAWPVTGSNFEIGWPRAPRYRTRSGSKCGMPQAGACHQRAQTTFPYCDFSRDS
jgi:hypothetical protein